MAPSLVDWLYVGVVNLSVEAGLGNKRGLGDGNCLNVSGERTRLMVARCGWTEGPQMVASCGWTEGPQVGESTLR